MNEPLFLLEIMFVINIDIQCISVLTINDQVVRLSGFKIQITEYFHPPFWIMASRKEGLFIQSKRTLIKISSVY